MLLIIKIKLSIKLTPYIIYLAHARPKHVVHATSIGGRGITRGVRIRSSCRTSNGCNKQVSESSNQTIFSKKRHCDIKLEPPSPPKRHTSDIEQNYSSVGAHRCFSLAPTFVSAVIPLDELLILSCYNIFTVLTRNYAPPPLLLVRFSYKYGGAYN